MPITKRRTKPAAQTAPTSARGVLRRQALLKAATAEFLKNGYEATAVADITARAGGSTATVYKHFGDKAGLFAAVVAQTHIDLEADLERHDFAHEPMEHGLLVFAQFYIEGMVSKRGAAFLRMVIAETNRFPELAETGFRGNRAMIDKLTTFLAAKSGQAGYVVDDPRAAAETFVSMLRGRVLATGLPPLKLAERPELIRFVDLAIRMFSATYRRP